MVFNNTHLSRFTKKRLPSGVLNLSGRVVSWRHRSSSFQSGWIHRQYIAGFFILSLLAVSIPALNHWRLTAGSAPANVVLPVISGNPVDGSTLSVSSGTWNNSPTGYTYQWQDCIGTTCHNISNATSNSYSVQSSDNASSLAVQVTATNGSGATTVSTYNTAAAISGSNSGGLISDSYLLGFALPSGCSAMNAQCLTTQAPPNWKAINEMNIFSLVDQKPTSQATTSGVSTSSAIPVSPLMSYSTGTISQYGNVITGTGTNFTASMTGMVITYSDNTTAVVNYLSPTELTTNNSKIVSSGSTYTIGGIPAGPIMLTDNPANPASGNYQILQTSGAGPGATSIPLLNSPILNYNYPSGASVISEYLDPAQNTVPIGSTMIGVVNAIHAGGAKALIAVGGSGDNNWDTDCSNGYQYLLGATLSSYINANNLDGVELDDEADNASLYSSCWSGAADAVHAVATPSNQVPIVYVDYNQSDTNSSVPAAAKTSVDQFAFFYYGYEPSGNYNNYNCANSCSELGGYLSSIESAGVPASRMLAGQGIAGAGNSSQQLPATVLTTTSAAESGSVSSISVSALPAAIPQGTIIIASTDGPPPTQYQILETPGAAAGATSIPISGYCNPAGYSYGSGNCTTTSLTSLNYTFASGSDIIQTGMGYSAGGQYDLGGYDCGPNAAYAKSNGMMGVMEWYDDGLGNTSLCYDQIQPFTSSGSVIPTTVAATNVTNAAATLNGTINPNGQPAYFYYKYGTSMSYGNSTACTSAGNGSTAVSQPVNITGLNPNTTYDFVVVASPDSNCATGQVSGGNQSFATLSDSSPIPSISSPTNGSTLSGSSASATASATGNGTDSLTSLTFKLDGSALSGTNCNVTNPVSGTAYTCVFDTTGFSNGSHTLQAVALDSANDSGAASISITIANPPQNTVLPSIAGTDTDGSTLTANVGNWTNSPTSYTYQWQDCTSVSGNTGTGCTNITGANSAIYTLASSDIGKYVDLIINASNTYGATAATSDASAVVKQAAPVNSTLPSVTGTLAVGDTLTANVGSWTNSPTGYTYQWQDCTSVSGNTGTGCTNVTSGGTSSSYTLAASDNGKYMIVKVTAANGGGSNSALSIPTAQVTIPSIGAPLNLIETSSTSSSINLGWSAPASLPSGCTITGYDVYRGNTKLTTSTGLSYLDSGLNPSNSYSYSVAAEATCSGLSDTSAAVTADLTTAVSSPTGLVITMYGPSEIDLSWSSPSDKTTPGAIGSDISKYTLYRCQGVNCVINPATDVPLGTSTNSSFVDDGSTMTADSNYTYGITATDNGSHVSSLSTSDSVVSNSCTIATTVTCLIASSTDLGKINAIVTSNEVLQNDGKLCNVTVNAGGILKGDGDIGSQTNNCNLTINSNGQVSPGHSPGCVTVNGNYNQVGIFDAEIQSPGTSPCTDYDQIVASGQVSLSGPLSVSLLQSFTPVVGQSFTLIDNTGSNTITGTFNGLSEGAVFAADGSKFRITYKGGNGNDLVLTTVNPATPITATLTGAKLPGLPNTGSKIEEASPVLVGLAITAALFYLVKSKRLRLNVRNK